MKAPTTPGFYWARVRPDWPLVDEGPLPVDVPPWEPVEYFAETSIYPDGHFYSCGSDLPKPVTNVVEWGPQLTATESDPKPRCGPRAGRRC